MGPVLKGPTGTACAGPGPLAVADKNLIRTHGNLVLVIHQNISKTMAEIAMCGTLMVAPL